MSLGYKWKWVKADMKKLSVLFILILLIACSLFAKGEIKVQSSVRSNAYTLDRANTESAGGLYRLLINGEDQRAEASSYVLVDADISKENVSVDFMIKQQQMTKTNESITISVEATQLSYTDYAANQTFSTYEFSFSAIGNPSISEDYLEVVADTPEDNMLILSLKYKSAEKTVERGTTIATFTANWEKNEDLVEHPGTYTADLTLKYTVN